MPSELLSRARAFEAEHLPSDCLPRFHVTAGTGWLNDPNGFSLYRGDYHLFYQYNPYSTHWDTMHWGHVTTKDFVRWERQPCALAPDEEYDRAGCFSGSGLELPDGRHLLMYTGVRQDEAGNVFQTQCAAVGDGRDYVKYPGNPVITASLLPPGSSTEHFRDPKIWRQDGSYYAVTGSLDPEDSGAVLLFRSEDALSWRFVSRVAGSRGRYGHMWECPDLFRLDGTAVLMVSPQEMKGTPEFLEGNTTICLLGTLERDGTLTSRSIQSVDYGLDFYAPQSLLTADGRRVMIAWMQYWGSVEVPPPQPLPFFGQMTLPRELRVKDGRLFQTPVRELMGYRGPALRREGLRLAGTARFPEFGGDSLDLTVEAEGDFTGLSLSLGDVFQLSYRRDTGTIRVRRRGNDAVLNERTFRVSDARALSLRLIVDRYSVELFVNDGEQAASFVVYPPSAPRGLTLEAEGDALVRLEQYPLNFS